MFIARNKVRMHDTDMAGVLYFARQFRFAHDALEDFAEQEGLPFNHVFRKEDFLFVIVHVEANYLVPLQIMDALEVHLEIEKIGNSSFTISYLIYKQDMTLVGTVKTVHVTIDAKTRKKIPIPIMLRSRLEKHLSASD